MAEKRLEDRLKVMIVDRLMLKAKPDEIGDAEDLIEQRGLESIQLLEIVIGLEDEFEVELGDDEFSIKKFRTVNNIAEVVRSKNAEA